MSCAKKKAIFAIIIVIILSLALILTACTDNVTPPDTDNENQETGNGTGTEENGTGNSGNSGNTGDTGNTGNSGNTGNTGDDTPGTDPIPQPPENTRGLIFELNEDGTGYYVTGYRGVNTEVVISNEYNGKPILGIAENAFENKDILTKVTISDGVTDIGSEVFDECENLREVVLPSDLTEIPESMFVQCLNLRKVDIPATVTKISEMAFTYCISLSNVTLPQGLEKIGDYAFGGCFSLTEITIPSTVETIGENVFAMAFNLVHITNLSEAEISESSEFESQLQTEIRTSEEEEFENVLTDDGNVTTYTVGETVYLLAYSKEGNVFDITGYGITDIPAYAVVLNNNLTEITIPEGVKNISNSAFYNCVNVLTLNLPSGLETASNEAFRLPKLVHVTNLSSVEVDFGDIAQNEGFEIRTSLDTEFSCPITTTENGAILLTIDEEIYLMGYVGESETLVVPEEVTSIPEYGIYCNEKIKVIEFIDGDNYCTIERQGITRNPILEKVILNNLSFDLESFYCNSALSQIVMDDDPYVPNKTFYGCASEVELIFSTTIEETSIRSYDNSGLDAYMVRCSDGIKFVSYNKLLYAFSEEDGGYFILDGCFDAYLASSANFKTATIADELFGYPVTKIKDNAMPIWRNSNYINTIIIPSSITDIGASAFNNCKQLNKIVYKGTKAQWDKVTKGTNWWGATTPVFECDDDSFTLSPNIYTISVAEDSSTYAKVSNLSITSGLQGDSFTFTVTITDDGYVLDTVTVNGTPIELASSWDKSYSATINGNMVIKVTTKVKQYSIRVAQDSSSHAQVQHISKMSGTQGETFTFTVNVYPGYEIDSVTVNGTAVYEKDGVYTGTINGTSMIKVTTKVATEAPQTYSIGIASDSSKDATVSLSKTSGTQGETFTFTVNVSKGYELVSVSVNDTAVSEINGVYTATVNGNTTVKVVTQEEVQEIPSEVDFQDGDFLYTYYMDGDYCAIRGYVGYSEVLTISGYCIYNEEKKEVRKIANEAFKANFQINAVEICSNITEIGEEAFFECANLNAVFFNWEYVPETLTIKNGAFGNIPQLRNIGINASKENWYNNVIAEEGWNFGSEQATIYCIDGEIRFDFSFNGFTYHFDEEKCAYIIKKHVGGESVVNVPTFVEGNGLMICGIGEGAFKDEESLTNVYIPLENFTLGASAFENCVNLHEVHIINVISKIGANAFNGCTSLTEIQFDNMYSYDWDNVEKEVGWNNGMENIILRFCDGTSISCDGSFVYDDLKLKIDESGLTCTVIKYLGKADVCSMPTYIRTSDGKEYAPMVIIIESNAFSDCPFLTIFKMTSNGGNISYVLKENAFLGANISCLAYDVSLESWRDNVTKESGWNNGLSPKCYLEYTNMKTGENETIGIDEL